MKNYFIVFEGIDGSGKDTQMMLFVENLRKYNKYSQIFITREPSNTTNYGKKIMYKLLNGGFKSVYEALELYLSDRILRSPLYKNILKFSNIVSSRYHLSTYAYQGMQGLSFDEILKKTNFLEKKFKLRITKPSITFLFDLNVKTALERIYGRGEAIEAFETEEQLEKAKKMYLNASEYLKKQGENIVIINANKSIQEIQKNVWEEYLKFLNI